MFKSFTLIVSAFIYTQLSFGQFNDPVHHLISFSSAGVYHKTKDLKSFVLNNPAGQEVHQINCLPYRSLMDLPTQNKQLPNNEISAPSSRKALIFTNRQ